MAKQQEQQTNSQLLKEQGAASFLGVQVRTLQSWRYLGKGPPFLRISKKAVRYKIEDLVSWIEKHRVEGSL